MRTRSRFLAGVALLVAGLVLGFGDLFLVLWSAKSGRPLGARTFFRLPPMVVPQIGIATTLVATVVASLASRRATVPLALRLTAPLAATLALLAALYLDPRATLWRALRPLRRAVGLPGVLALDVALIAAAVVVLRVRRAHLADAPDAAAAPTERAR